MAVHNWPAQSERFPGRARFTERFFASINSGSFSAKWREVNLSAPLKGWQRFQPAERWLAANAQANVQPATAAGAQQLKIMLQKFVRASAAAPAGQETLPEPVRSLVSAATKRAAVPAATATDAGVSMRDARQEQDMPETITSDGREQNPPGIEGADSGVRKEAELPAEAQQVEAEAEADPAAENVQRA